MWRRYSIETTMRKMLCMSSLEDIWNVSHCKGGMVKGTKKVREQYTDLMGSGGSKGQKTEVEKKERLFMKQMKGILLVLVQV